MQLASFLQFSLWFSVFVNTDGGILIFLPNAFYIFSGFAKEVTSCSHAKTVIPGDHLQLEECITSLVSLSAVILGLNGCQADYEKLKIAQKRKFTISQISHYWSE